MYVPTKSKSDSLLAKREIFTDRKDVTLSVDEIARENDSPSRWCHWGKSIWDVSKDTRSWDSSRKAFVWKVREIGVAANWTISTSVVRKDAHPWGEVASGKRPSWKDRFLLSSCSWDKDYLSVWRTLYNWNLRFITGPRPEKHILWRCVDIW